MPNHLGRNPFNKATKIPRHSFIQQDKTSLIEWLLIRLPAKALLLALKTGLLAKSAVEPSDLKPKD